MAKNTKKKVEEEIRQGQIGQTNDHITDTINNSKELGASLDAIYEDFVTTPSATA